VGNVKDVKGDTKEFAEKLVHLVEERRRGVRVGNGGGGARSVVGSWEVERVELIVDIPVWSPGCFQGTQSFTPFFQTDEKLAVDLSTLHSLRDTTLSHTHNLLTYLLKIHSLPASYRLLARSATSNLTSHPSCPAPGWGCIRLSPPSKSTPSTPHRELRPAVRRSSLAHDETGAGRRRSNGQSVSPVRVKLTRGDFDEAIISDDEDEGLGVELKEGYRSSGGSDDEGEEECADVLVAREVEKRGSKEG
jgi:hypothetical protein